MNLTRFAALAFILFLFSNSLFAQIKVSASGIDYEQGAHVRFSDIDTIVVFDTISVAGDPTIAFSYSNSTPYNYSWYKVSASGETFLGADNGVLSSNLKISESDKGEGTYRVDVSDVATLISKHITVVNHSLYKATFDSIIIYDGDVRPDGLSMNKCSEVFLEARYSAPSINIYVPGVGDQVLTPYHEEFEWSWASGDPKTEYDTTVIKSTPVTEEVVYACTIYNNFFSRDDAKITSAKNSKDYFPIAVSLEGLTASVTEGPDNEADREDLGTVGWLKGSGPIDATFEAKEPSLATDLYIWEVFDGQDTSLIERENGTSSFRYIFRTPLRDRESNAPDYLLKLTTNSAEMCSDSAVINIKLKESHLAIPNLFVIGFGSSLPYKADYRSLKEGTFKGFIYSRNGRRVHQWTDPDAGWDGKKGKGYVAPGAYVVVLYAEGTDGIEYKIRQTLTILKEK